MNTFVAKLIRNTKYTKGDTKLLSLCAIRAYNAQKKEKGYSVVQVLSNKPKTKIVLKKFVEIQSDA